MAIEKSKNVPPFVRFCTASIPMVFDDSLSYYECLCALTNFIQKELVEVVNNNADLLEGLNVKFDELKAYVDNYFDNLDVQEEINAKLDDMAESGELATYIAQFVELGPLFTYDTLGDLVAADNLAAGCTARTLGKVTLNDGYGAYYKIDTTGEIALDNGLYATLEDNFGGNNYYDEITLTTGRANNADYYYVTIPLNDNEGNMIECYVNDETDNPTRGPLQYADDELTTVTVNAGFGWQDSHGTWQQPTVICNGVITHRDENDVPPEEWWSYIGITADRTILEFANNATPEYMLAQGALNAYMTQGKIVTNGVVTVKDVWTDVKMPYSLLGVKADKTIIIFTSDGRTEHDTGMTMPQVAAFMANLGCINVWRCDGGGSTSLIYKGSKQNRNIDENGTKDRNIWVTLNVKKKTIDEQLARAYSYIGKERQLLNKQIREDMVATYQPKQAFLGYYNTTTGYNVITGGWDDKITLKCSDFLTAFDPKTIEPIQDENDKYIGFRINKANAVIKVSINGTVLTTSSAGNRRLYVHRSDEVSTGSNRWTQSWIDPSGAHTYSLNFTTTFANYTSGAEYYFQAAGSTGDDFSRLNIAVEDLGTAWAE